jgi:hypothetical protein
VAIVNGSYEVVLAPAAKRAVLGMRLAKDRDRLADALRVELAGGPNAGKKYQFDPYDGGRDYADRGASALTVYTAVPLSFDGYIAIHRPMSREEIQRLRREQGYAARRGFYVLDILPVDSGFTRRPHYS